MITLILVAILLAVLYVGIAIWVTKEIPESVSAMVYVLPDGGWRWLWTLWMWAVSLLTCIPCIEILSRIGMEFLGFGTMGCLMLCGAVPLFEKDKVTMHWVTGTSGCILSQL